MKKPSKRAFGKALFSYGYSDVADDFLDVFGSISGISYRRERDEWNAGWEDK